MKRFLWIAVGACLLIAVMWAGLFYWRHLRGAAPAFTGPPQDIVKLMEKAESARAPTVPVQNTTGFPLKLPPGFSISIFAKNLGNPRVLGLDASGTLLASVPSQGRLVALPDADRDGVSDKIVTVVSNLNRPHGFAFHPHHSRKLYIAEVEQVAAYEYDPHTLKAANKQKIAELPSGGRHWTRTLLFSPDAQRLLISVGSSCDTCVEKDPRHGTIQVVAAGGGSLKPFATGLRNAPFMTRHPVSGHVWVTEMGRDFLGDNLPPDEINIVHEGKDYGWPWCYGQQIHDNDFDPTGKKKSFCKETAPSHIDIPAHSAPLGLAFFPATPAWPQEYHHNLLVAYHGSWNRTIPTGYKVVRYKLDDQGKYLGEEDFITGWLTSEGALGRPADILIRPDGVMFISDDKAGVVYRVACVAKP
jgi:glucose/arabinose dehydrogenase